MLVGRDERRRARAMGQPAFFAEYLEATGLFEDWLRTCPLKGSSPNAPALVDVLASPTGRLRETGSRQSAESAPVTSPFSKCTRAVQRGGDLGQAEHAKRGCGLLG